jgi:hypothetical protein
MKELTDALRVVASAAEAGLVHDRDLCELVRRTALSRQASEQSAAAVESMPESMLESMPESMPKSMAEPVPESLPEPAPPVQRSTPYPVLYRTYANERLEPGPPLPKAPVATSVNLVVQSAPCPVIYRTYANTPHPPSPPRLRRCNAGPLGLLGPPRVHRQNAFGPTQPMPTIHRRRRTTAAERRAARGVREQP